MAIADQPTPFYFPLGPDFSTGQAPPSPIREDQYGHGAIDGRVFQFTADSDTTLQFKRELLVDHADHHVGRVRLSPEAHACVCGFIAERLAAEYPDRFTREALAGQSFEQLAMQVPEDLAIVCAEQDADGQITKDWLAAAHICIPSGWDPAAQLGESFARIHRAVQVSEAKRFLIKDGHRADYVGQMLRCRPPHVRFIWTLQVGDALNRNPRTRRPPKALVIDGESGEPNVWFRVERQTLSAFPEVGAVLFTIRTYLYPLAEIMVDERRRAALKQAVTDMPERVLAYKGWGEPLVAYLKKI